MTERRRNLAPDDIPAEEWEERSERSFAGSGSVEKEGTPQRRLLSVEELSAYLSLPKATIYSWASMRKIPGIVKLGRSLRFEKEAIDRWVDQAKSEPRRREDP